jgi:hypothetical protein
MILQYGMQVNLIAPRSNWTATLYHMCLHRLLPFDRPVCHNLERHSNVYNLLSHLNALSIKSPYTIAFSLCFLQLILNGSTSMLLPSPPSHLHICTTLATQDGSAPQYNFPVLLLLLIPPRAIPLRLPPPITNLIPTQLTLTKFRGRKHLLIQWVTLTLNTATSLVHSHGSVALLRCAPELNMIQRTHGPLMTISHDK